MDRTEIEDKVRDVLAAQLMVDRAQVTMEARFAEDLDADSLDLVEAIMAVEDAFGIKIPEPDMEGVTTVGQAVELTAAKLGVAV
jgi:acyl carrier protein